VPTRCARMPRSAAAAWRRQPIPIAAAHTPSAPTPGARGYQPSRLGEVRCAAAPLASGLCARLVATTRRRKPWKPRIVATRRALVPHNSAAASTQTLPYVALFAITVAAAALEIVGSLMVSHLRHTDISEFSVALPVMLTVTTMPFSYSIANGIGVGVIAWVVLRLAADKAREISGLPLSTSRAVGSSR
jgi:hypothetical protein